MLGTVMLAVSKASHVSKHAKRTDRLLAKLGHCAQKGGAVRHCFQCGFLKPVGWFSADQSAFSAGRQPPISSKTRLVRFHAQILQ